MSKVGPVDGLPTWDLSGSCSWKLGLESSESQSNSTFKVALSVCLELNDIGC